MEGAERGEEGGQGETERVSHSIMLAEFRKTLIGALRSSGDDRGDKRKKTKKAAGGGDGGKRKPR